MECSVECEQIRTKKALLAHTHLATSGGAPSHPAAGVLKSLRSAMANPLPWSIALGAVFAATSLQLPGPLGQIIKMLGDAATPVALFTIGAVL